MTFRGGAGSDGDDLTPWQRAGVPVELWEKAIDVSTADYEALVRRLAEIYAQRNLGAWIDGRRMAALAHRRIVAIKRGDRNASDRALRGRHASAG